MWLGAGCNWEESAGRLSSSHVPSLSAVNVQAFKLKLKSGTPLRLARTCQSHLFVCTKFSHCPIFHFDAHDSHIQINLEASNLIFLLNANSAGGSVSLFDDCEVC